MNVHALPCLSISEHAMRARLEAGPASPTPVLGALLATPDSSAPGVCDIPASFELAMTPLHELDTSIWEQRRDQYHQVWPSWTVCGLYAVDTAPTPTHTTMSHILCPTDDPCYLLLLSPISNARQSWQAFLRTGPTWTPCPLQVTPSDTEQVVLDDAHREGTYSDTAKTDALLTSLQADRQAVHKLHEILSKACAYVAGMQQGHIPFDSTMLRTLHTALVNQQGAQPAPDSHTSSQAVWASFLTAMTENLRLLHDLTELHAFATPTAHRAPL
ncbi:hypothetical protein ACI68E_002410 [Malassezia pachydermatis]